jgi:hypothetical protein
MLQKVSNFADMLKQMDKIGLVASLVCGVHCLLTPLLVVAAPSISVQFANNPELEAWLIVFSLLSSYTVLGYDYFKIHKVIWPILIVTIGWAINLGNHLPFIKEDLHVLLSILGALVVGYAFIRNWQLRRLQHQCEVHPLS